MLLKAVAMSRPSVVTARMALIATSAAMIEYSTMDCARRPGGPSRANNKISCASSHWVNMALLLCLPSGALSVQVSGQLCPKPIALSRLLTCAALSHASSTSLCRDACLVRWFQFCFCFRRSFLLRLFRCERGQPVLLLFRENIFSSGGSAARTRTNLHQEESWTSCQARSD